MHGELTVLKAPRLRTTKSLLASVANWMSQSRSGAVWLTSSRLPASSAAASQGWQTLHWGVVACPAMHQVCRHVDDPFCLCSLQEHCFCRSSLQSVTSHLRATLVKITSSGIGTGS